MLPRHQPRSDHERLCLVVKSHRSHHLDLDYNKNIRDRPPQIAGTVKNSKAVDNRSSVSARARASPLPDLGADGFGYPTAGPTVRYPGHVGRNLEGESVVVMAVADEFGSALSSIPTADSSGGDADGGDVKESSHEPRQHVFEFHGDD